MRALLMVLLMSGLGLAGCLSDGTPASDDLAVDPAPSLDYEVPDPDMALDLVEFDVFLPGADGVEIHARIVKPAGDGPFPVIAQFTPYTAPGENTMLDAMLEPALGNNNGRFDTEFVRRGYAFAYADVRGTGDSTGCLDLRGQGDIRDLYELTEFLGTQEWSNGNVGFIGASYPGSEAHMAALAGNPHLKAVIPVVASTSFYHYHHNDGVPYNANHALGGTNAGYTRNALMPTLNPQSPNYLPKYVQETAECGGYVENAVHHGGMDQTGAYYDWWQERNLRPGATTVDVPVLMAQGLADWNVKPDHIATWFNDMPTASKTLIAGQWGHAYPYSPCADGQTTRCDDDVPYGEWWAYATAFFDTYLKEVDTGMFQGSTAWVQDNDGAWHRSADWPLVPDQGEELVFTLLPDATAAAGTAHVEGEAVVSFHGCPDNAVTQGVLLGGVVEGQVAPCRDDPDQSVSFTTPAFEQDILLSGVPLVELAVDTDGRDLVHLTVVMEVLDENGDVVSRENHGYLNPVFRHDLDDPQDLPPAGEVYPVQIDLYPQEDLVKAGQKLRFIVAHDDDGRTIEVFEEGTTHIHFGGDHVNQVRLPVRPADLQGTRLG